MTTKEDRTLWLDKELWGEDVEEWENDPEYRFEELAEDIGDQINALMGKKGLSKADLAEALGHSRAYVTQLLRGSANFQLKTLAKLSVALRVYVHVDFDPTMTLMEAASKRYERWEQSARTNITEMPRPNNAWANSSPPSASARALGSIDPTVILEVS